jgi:hypothetical protein
LRRFRVVFRPATGRRLLEDVDADDLRTEGAYLVFRRDVLVLRRPRTVVALRVLCTAVTRVETRCPPEPVPAPAAGSLRERVQ